MVDEISKAMHEQLAKDLFNLTWDLLDQDERSQQDADRMVHAAHASRYHWGEAGTSLEHERGEWQISRVYAVLGRSEPALYHAQRCLDICQAAGIADFDLAFAYEALARGHAVAGDRGEAQRYLDLAQGASGGISDEANREYVSWEMASVSEMLAH